MFQDYLELQSRKRRWIPLACAGRCTIARAAREIGITPFSVSRLKRRYREIGASAFVNGHLGKSYQRKKFGEEARKNICEIYRKHWNGSNFSAFRERLSQFHGVKIGANTLKKVLEGAGIFSPKRRKTKKKSPHLPRPERKSEGELLQMDASEYDWLMTGERLTLHGAVDDATHALTGLYLCRSECRLGYSEVMRRTLERHGIPRAVYIDRHAALVKNARKKGKTQEERLEYSREERTHWTEICRELGVEVILALSPEAKGRVERCWQTLQGRLPSLLRFLGIRTMEAANEFLGSYVTMYGERFAVPPSLGASFRRVDMGAEEMERLLAVKVRKRTNARGEFVFHGERFRLLSARRACVDFILCLSEKTGIRAFFSGKFHPVELAEPLTDCIGDQMPQVEKDLVRRYMEKSGRLRLFPFGGDD